ncbi:MAG: (Fe-S)-binding protein [Bacteroidales bacterium]|nr:(Fe-S)-binding protein [Bacteroidales bacterium]
MAEQSNIINVFIPCQMDLFQPNTAYSVMSVMEGMGLHCQYFDTPTCCGRRFHLEGEIECAKALAGEMLDIYARNKVPFIVPDCACAGYMKKYYRQLLENSFQPPELRSFVQHVYEMCDYIVNIQHTECLDNFFPHRVFYFKSCAARNLYPDNDAPETLLRNTRGLDLLMDEEMQGCCGANGRFALANPTATEAMIGDIVQKIYNRGAEYVTSTDLHCLQMIDAYTEAHEVGIKVMHIADILKGE